MNQPELDLRNAGDEYEALQEELARLDELLRWSKPSDGIAYWFWFADKYNALEKLNSYEEQSDETE